MKDLSRRSIAFIAGKIIFNKNITSVYDYISGKYYNFGGIITNSNFSIYDYDNKCYISISKNGTNSYSIFHYGNSKYMTFEYNKNDFKGFDYDSSRYFSGKVNMNSIAIYDYETSKYYNYSV